MQLLGSGKMKISLKNRKIGYTYGSISGYYAFRKEKSIAFESTLERDLLVVLEFYDLVLDVIEQPVTLEYFGADGNCVQYTPDFLVHFKLSSQGNARKPYPKPMLIEVKPSKKLKSDFSTLRPKFKLATKYALENGYVFKIFDEKKIRGQAFKNISFLARYKNYEYDPDERHRIISNLMILGEVTIENLLASLYVTDSERGIGLGHVWHLIANKHVVCDIGLPLGKHTVVWAKEEENNCLGAHYAF
ncbi:heteromeric transposase endonuclease subunit TnsA [Sulfurimonas sp. HSL-3221]|uniref:heteromeric transposase endonuclease subunit TnsA n=1 Tax=Sulfurimonadaceae TaxID=2771471 RepID=UPI001E5CF7C1|nr:heteromeric transposase endonuclease subunit TnsA [Sulfurimonas sp. HSL-3221]UFS62733.1 heteromeric transposase endonuclease subunit TnsA [Sulfurimonas sp. HSL-3221]